jgi:hypothetical protein
MESSRRFQAAAGGLAGGVGVVPVASVQVPLPQSKNKIDVEVRALDLGFQVMAAVICRSAAAAQDRCLVFVARHAGENGLELLVSASQLSDLRNGSCEAAPGSFPTAVLGRQPSKLVVGRLLPPPLSVMVYSGRRLQVYNNL